MKRILIVLDSCRYDSYVKANTSLIDKNIGLPKKAVTDCNYTIPSFTIMMASNVMPRPYGSATNPWFKRRFNFIFDLQKKGTKVHFITDNMHLHPMNRVVGGFMKAFTTFKFFEENYNSAEDIMTYADKINLGKSYYLILWLGETHQPYSFGNTVTKNWLGLAKKANRYSAGKESITKGELEYLKSRQIGAVEWLTKKLWNKFLNHHMDADIIITADHGESFGENHIYGHGNDIHPVQFMVPFVRRGLK